MSEFKACGRTTGHGDCCAIGWLCGSCQARFDQLQHVEKLNAENALFRQLLVSVRKKLSEDYFDRYAALDEIRERIDLALEDTSPF